MQANFCCRWVLVSILVLSPFFLATYAKGGGGGGRGGSRGGGYSSSRSSSRPSPSYSLPSPSYSRPSPSYSRPAPSYSRPAPAPAPRPAPAPAPRPAPPALRPASSYIPSHAALGPALSYIPSHTDLRPAPSYIPSHTAPKPAPPAIVQQPAYNPYFKESNPGIGVGNRQPAYNFDFNNYKLDGSRPVGPSLPDSPVGQSVTVYHKGPYSPLNYRLGAGDRQPAYNPNFNSYNLDGSRPAGPPPPYSPVGQPVLNAPVGHPPSYQSLSHQRPYPQQPPAYSGEPGRPPAYPGLASHLTPAQPGSQFYSKQPELYRPYVVQSGTHQLNAPRPHPVQPGYSGSHQPNTPKLYPVQPGHGGSHQPNTPKPYPVQPGHGGSHQPNTPKPYPVQPGHGGSHQLNAPKPYPVQPGNPNPHPVGNRPYPPQTLGGNVWQPNYGSPAPSYMNYGGIPTGTNMYVKPHKKKGFLGSLMSLGKDKSGKKNKYYGSYPSPYGVGNSGKSHGVDSFLGKHGSSAAMYSIFPYMAAKKAHKIKKPKFGYLPIYTSRSHHHHYHHGYHGDMDPEYASYFNVYDDKYVGKCQHPIKKNHSKVNCSGTFDELQCVASCEEGYKFPNETKSLKNKCWHVTGVWTPMKNFPDCMPVCTSKCLNGGQCIAPEVCKCPAEYRGSLCQFHKRLDTECEQNCTGPTNFLKCNILKLIKDEKLSWVCKHHKNETICHVRCKATMEFDFTPPTEYRCTPDGVWKPDTLPKCDSDKS